MFETSWVRRGQGYRAVAAAVCLVGALFLQTPATAQVTSTWIGGAGNWQPCPQQSGNALWNTCPNYPNGNYNAVIAGGPVSISFTNHDDESVVNLTIDSADALTFDGGYLHVTGSSIRNNGSITISNGGALTIDGSSVTLSGSGSLSLQTSNAAIVGEPGVSVNFVNQQLISGQGSVGIGELAITNQGTINATGGTLTVEPSAVGITNTGTMEASSGATLDIAYGVSAPLTNSSGAIKALDGAIVLVQGPSITGGTLTTSGSGFFEIVGGNTAVLNNLTNAGNFIIETGGSAALEGAINNTGTIRLGSTGGGTDLYINGTVNLSGSGSVTLGGSGTQSNFIGSGTGSDTLVNQSTIQGAGSIGSTGLTVTNQGLGLINANATTNPLKMVGAPANNAATLEASSGATLNIFNTINNAGGTIKALTGSTVLLEGNGTIKGGTLATSGTGTIQSLGGGTLDGTTNTVTNSGAITLSSSASEELYLKGTINNTGTITLNGSCLGLQAPTTLTGSGKVTMNSNACFLAFNQSYTLTNKSTIQGAGSIGDSNPMQITNNGTIIANQTSPLLIVPANTGFTNNGRLIVNAGSTLNIQNFFTNLSGGTLKGGTYQVAGTLQLPGDITTNAGNITLTGTASQMLDQSSQKALASFATNATNGSFTLAGNQSFTTSGSFSNAGVMKISKGCTFTISKSGNYTQTSGRTTVDGTLATSSTASFPSGSLFLALAGSIQINGGSVFGNGGNLSAHVSSGGTITPADSSTSTGILTVTGGYTQNSTGALDINLASSAQFNQLNVTGTAALNGTLNIGLLNGFVPPLNSTFKVLTYSSRTGTFSTANGVHINNNEHFKVLYNSNNVTLQVVSGP